MRVRKNIECLSTSELHDLREAFAGIYQLPESDPKSFARIAGLHGSPEFLCKHASTDGFLSWHRAYLLELEDALREIKCNVTIPFWDWNSTSKRGIPEACKNATYKNRRGAIVDNPLFRGPIAPSVGGGFTYRAPNINDRSFATYEATANNNQSQLSWPSYASNLNVIHGSIHSNFSGSMSTLSHAAFDPIFYFHHANVDRLWANWQSLHGVFAPSSELNSVLIPFTRPFTNNWHTGQDFQNITDLGYRYKNRCIIWNEPIPWPGIPHVFKLKIEPWMRESPKIEVVLATEMMPIQSMEVRVFINEPKANSETQLLKNRNYAGSIGIFGMGMMSEKAMSSSFDRELKLDITESLKAHIDNKRKSIEIAVIPVNKFPMDIKEKDSEVYELSLEIF